MFAESIASKLDLSSFTLNDSAILDRAFNGTKATVGYAKDEETAVKFNDNSVTGIQSTLKFIVK